MSVNEFDDTGRVVLVTGGTKGIGRVIVQRFLDWGAEVMTCGRTGPEDLPSSGGRTAGFFAADVRDPEAAAALVDATVDRYGSIDVVVNNAGGAPAADTATASPRFSESIIRLNLLAPLHVAQRANHHMQLAPNGGVIVNILGLGGPAVPGHRRVRRSRRRACSA